MTAPTHADLLARIAELRAQDEARTPGAWFVVDGGMTFNPSVATRDGDVYSLSPNEWVAECSPEQDRGNQDAAAIVSAVNHFGPLLTLAEGVLERHRPEPELDFCVQWHSESEARWPCPEVRAVIEALGMGGGK